MTFFNRLIVKCSHRLQFFVLGLILSLTLTQHSLAATGLIAEEIQVKGAQRIEVETIRSYIPIGVGQEITNKKMDDALKKLFSTGLFADVIVRNEGSKVIVLVVENPIINRIAFEGNKRITNELLQDELKLQPRVVFTRKRVQNDVQRVIDLYRRSGRFSATVVPKVIQQSQNRVDLIFEISEGPETQIRRITFVGNKRFSDSDLRSVIRTKESAWYRFLTSEDSYDPDRLTFDRELLRRFYLNKGFADFRVLSAIAELSPDRKSFFITFTVEEGKRYRFGQINVTAKLRDLSPNQLKSHINASDGDWYNADVVEKIVLKLTEVVGELGYGFVEVRPKVNRDNKNKKININFDIREGPRVFVERIDISGNVRTIDSVIRREMPLVEGDAFNSSKMRQLRKRIRNLGFFEKVAVKKKRGSKRDKTIIDVKVSERSTGQVTLGAGFSSTSGALGELGIQEKNLLGKGQNLLFKTRVGASSTEVDIAFTEPYFLNRKLAAGVDIFKKTYDLKDESSFEKSSLGGGLRLGYDYSDNLKQKFQYSLSHDEVTDVKDDASLAIQEQKGSAVKSELSQTLSFETLDNRFSPTEGTIGRFTTSLAGLGGSVKFFKTNFRTKQYFPLSEKITGSLGIQGGYIIGLGEDIRIVDRFFLGGSSLRGFKASGVGPRDKATGDSIGGKFMLAGTAQLMFPLGLPNEFGVKGRLFSDIGSLTNSESTNASINEDNSLRASVGFGISWKSPLGPLAIDISQPILKKDFDKTELIRFDIGARF